MEHQATPPGCKRSACDRCRSHKLRCVRAASSSSPVCERCARAGTECITGPALPAGRPFKYVTCSTAITKSSNRRSSEACTYIRRRVHSKPQLHPTLQQVDPVKSLDSFQPSRKSYLDFTNRQADYTASQSTFSHKGFHSGVEMNRNGPHIVATAPSLTPALDQTAFGQLNEKPLSYTLNYYQSYLCSSFPTTSGKDASYLYVERLALVSDGLQRQMRAAHEILSPTTINPAGNTTNFDDHDRATKELDVLETCFGRLLQSVQELLDILNVMISRSDINNSKIPSVFPSRTFYPPRGAKYTESNLPGWRADSEAGPRIAMNGAVAITTTSKTPSTSNRSSQESGWPENRRKVDTSTAILIFTCHARVVYIESVLFAHMRRLYLWTTRNAMSSYPYPRDSYGLGFGGHMVRGYQDLRYKITIQVAIHMLSRIEGILGLPEQYTLCRNSPSHSPGILDEQTASSIMDMVIQSEACETDQLYGIHSLRQDLTAVQHMMRTGT